MTYKTPDLAHFKSAHLQTPQTSAEASILEATKPVDSHLSETIMAFSALKNTLSAVRPVRACRRVVNEGTPDWYPESDVRVISQRLVANF